MQYLQHDRLLDINTEAVDLGLHMRREELLGGLSNAYVAGLPTKADPAGQLLSDLIEMNKTPFIADNVVPLYRWLRNAAYALSVRPDKRDYFRGLADEVINQRAAAVPAAAKVPREGIPERVIFVNDMVPFGFLKGAERTGRSTARLTVPSFQGSAPRKFPNTNRQKSYFGTGWLIGPKHIITNYHVVDARSEGETNAEKADFELQALRTSVEFDYDDDLTKGLTIRVARLAAANATLDYAILELEASPERPPLTLWGRQLEFDANAYLPVNIIQHPNGNSKQMGIRNNLAAKLTERDLAYFTDTDGGSSGSAVCNDQWQVIALHKASDPTLGEFEYQGKRTAWVNTGTRIDRIIDDLRSNATLWAAIAPDVAG